MTKQHVMGIVSTGHQVASVVNNLRSEGFLSQDVSVLFSGRVAASENRLSGKYIKAPGLVQGVSTGGILGGTVGWLAGIGSCVIPGLGLFVASGPFMAALSGVAIGATVGGVTGALVGMGAPEYKAKNYESRLKEGKILISVYVKDGRDIELVKDILHHVKAQDVLVVNEMSSARF